MEVRLYNYSNSYLSSLNINAKTFNCKVEILTNNENGEVETVIEGEDHEINGLIQYVNYATGSPTLDPDIIKPNKK